MYPHFDTFIKIDFFSVRQQSKPYLHDNNNTRVSKSAKIFHLLPRFLLKKTCEEMCSFIWVNIFVRATDVYLMICKKRAIVCFFLFEKMGHSGS